MSDRQLELLNRFDTLLDQYGYDEAYCLMAQYCRDNEERAMVAVLHDRCSSGKIKLRAS